MSLAIALSSANAHPRVSRFFGGHASRRPPLLFFTHRRHTRVPHTPNQWLCFARGGRADNQGIDPDGLSPSERAAMRNEWSRECRQVGLDHLAECFNQPAVVNPVDGGDGVENPGETMRRPIPADPSREKRDGSPPSANRSPIKELTKNIQATKCEPSKMKYLNGAGAFGVTHTGNGAFDAHLVGVRRVMQLWRPDESKYQHLHDAGLFHSIYGSEGFQGFCLPYAKRDELIDMIGEKAERLVWMFCVVDRLSVDNDLDAESGTHAFKARPELGGGDIKMNDETWFDFITLTLGDWLEQVEAAALSSNDLFQWGVGDAWGYRRGAYARMAEILGEELPVAKACWKNTYANETEATKNVRQPVTPPMSAEIARGREGRTVVEPRYP